MKWKQNYNLVVLFLVMVFFTGFNIWFARDQARQARQATCPVFTLLDSVYTAQPPTTPTGITLSVVVHRIAADCPKDTDKGS